jgi:hypothetical protein
MTLLLAWVVVVVSVAGLIVLTYPSWERWIRYHHSHLDRRRRRRK